ncbi:MAG: hypothetical protein ACR2QK_25005 [Acidimicrobiales bacterium]
MDSPFQKRVFLTEEERQRFEQLIEELEPELAEPTESGVRWPRQPQALFWSHLGPCALLLPVGLILMIVSVLTWWPLGLLGLAIATVGMRAVNALLAHRFMRSSFAAGRRGRRTS